MVRLYFNCHVSIYVRPEFNVLLKFEHPIGRNNKKVKLTYRKLWACICINVYSHSYLFLFGLQTHVHNFLNTSFLTITKIYDYFVSNFSSSRNIAGRFLNCMNYIELLISQLSKQHPVYFTINILPARFI